MNRELGITWFISMKIWCEKKTSIIEQNNLKQIMKMLGLIQEAKFIQN